MVPKARAWEREERGKVVAVATAALDGVHDVQYLRRPDHPRYPAFWLPLPMVHPGIIEHSAHQ